MLVLLLIAASALVILLLTMIMNLFIFPKLNADDKPLSQPLVSLLIPARNEADVIERTVQHILAQSYTNIEVIILDDQSDDGTGKLALKAANGDHRLQVISGEELPSGWMGKSWACQTLGKHASGAILIFTDADVIWKPDALSSVISQLQSAKVDMVTVWSTQITETFAERVTVPCIAMVILGYLPTVMVHHSPLSMFAAANGQVMAWRRAVYEAIGGHQLVANNVLDDVTLAKAAKKQGFRIRMVDGNNQILTRMYDDWDSVRDGFAKNILAGYGGAIPLLLGTVFHWIVFLLPYVALLFPEYRLWAAIIILAGLALRAVSAIFTHQRVIDTFWMPLTVILFTIIALQSLYWNVTGGPIWKGRKLGKDNMS